MLVAVSASATVLYVNNVITLNHMQGRADALNKSIDSLRSLNQNLRAETYRLQSSERISRIATERLGMIASPKAPVVLTETAH